MREDTLPRIVITVASAADHPRPEYAARRNALYLDAVRRHGGRPVPVEPTTPERELAHALDTMDGLLLSGGADIDPARYRQPNRGSRDIEPERDELEARAWAAAATRDLPVLGICRGIQAINVFSGGSLLQDVPGHEAAGRLGGAPATHPLRLVPGTRLASILQPDEPDSAEPLLVNAFHHQGILEADLAAGLVPAAWADSSAGPLVEGLEGSTGRFLVGVQCHPERQDSTPAAFERLFGAFVAEAARSAAESAAPVTAPSAGASTGGPS
jgi:gamma-glutamyl-gamma-aminobutyrate hydrolase PuuD